jgi:hypothetical protein
MAIFIKHEDGTTKPFPVTLKPTTKNNVNHILGPALNKPTVLSIKALTRVATAAVGRMKRKGLLLDFACGYANDDLSGYDVAKVCPANFDPDAHSTTPATWFQVSYEIDEEKMTTVTIDIRAYAWRHRLQAAWAVGEKGLYFVYGPEQVWSHSKSAWVTSEEWMAETA